MRRPAPNGVPPWLYLVVVSALALYLVIGAVTWAVLTFNGIDMPEAFATILATITGGLVGILTPQPQPRQPGASEEAGRPDREA